MPTVGEIFVCSHCHRESVVKTERVMDGWTLVREQLVCALCRWPLDVAPQHEAPQSLDDAGRQAASRLLGEAVEPRHPQLTRDRDHDHFCKDCAHFLRHPFVSRCLFHGRPTEPMDDCPDFHPRTAEESNGETDV